MKIKKKKVNFHAIRREWRKIEFAAPYFPAYTKHTTGEKKCIEILPLNDAKYAKKKKSTFATKNSQKKSRHRRKKPAARNNIAFCRLLITRFDCKADCYPPGFNFHRINGKFKFRPSEKFRFPVHPKSLEQKEK